MTDAVFFFFFFFQLSGTVPGFLSHLPRLAALGLTPNSFTAANASLTPFMTGTITGGTPFSTLAIVVASNPPLTVCPAGAFATGVSSNAVTGGSIAWPRATCGSCARGSISSASGASHSGLGSTFLMQFAGALVCTLCPPNTYDPLPSGGGTACTLCPASSLSGLGSVAISNCTCASPYAPVNASADGSFACAVCDAGSFFSLPGGLGASGVCAPCPAGLTSNAGATFCTLCPKNTYGARRLRWCDASV